MIRGCAAMMIAAAVMLPGSGHAADNVRDVLGNEAIELMIDNSGAGQAEALLGVLYLRGMRSEPDPVAALAWLDRAARAGHPAGIYAAARIYAEGIGVPADAEKARSFLRDHDPAQFGPLADAVRQLRLSLDLPAQATPLVKNIPPPASPPVDTAPTPATAIPPSQPSVAAEIPASPLPTLAAPPVPDPPPAAVATADTPVAVPPVAAPVPADVLPGPVAQLATLFSESSTTGEIPRLRAAIPASLLEGRDLVIRPTKLADGRAAWRVLAIGFANRDDVRGFCAALRNAGLPCIPRG